MRGQFFAWETVQEKERREKKELTVSERARDERQRPVIRSVRFNAKRGYLNVTCAVHPYVILFMLRQITLGTLRPPFPRGL